MTLRSIGGVNLSVTALAVAGPHAADFSVAGSCTAGSELQSVTILQAGGSCDVAVSFQPAAGGARNATITLTYAGATTFPSAQAIALSGQGTAPLVPAAAIDPVYIDFGEIVRNATSAPRTIVLANPGTAPLLVGSLSVTGQHAGEFGLSGTCMGAALPLQIGAGGSCTVVVDFTPQGLELRNAELRIQHNAAGSPGLVALTGVGVAPTCAAAAANASSRPSPVRRPGEVDHAVPRVGRAPAATGWRDPGSPSPTAATRAFRRQALGWSSSSIPGWFTIS
ncbi:MAG: choice-of-anchor D domain-containing protein [Betaproteobacteria bacterium]|nr:choice-of-anchor D domain-containing protein [Betaproteobacteria bacterium]